MYIIVFDFDFHPSSLQTQAAAPQKQPKSEPAPEISLRPNAGVALKNQSDQGKGWSNLQTTTGNYNTYNICNIYKVYIKVICKLVIINSITM